MLTDRILIVDDEPSNARLVQRALVRAGYNNVQVLLNSCLALEVVQEIDPQLLILDLHMSTTDGFDVLRLLRGSVPAETLLPVLVVTADSSADSLQRARSLGADDYLVKPFSLDQLVLRVEGLLSMRVACAAADAEAASLRRQIGDCRHIITEAELYQLGQLADNALPEEGADGHCDRVGELAGLLAERMALDDDVVAAIRAAAPLHDIGKVAVSDGICSSRGHSRRPRWRSSAITR